MIQFGNPSAIKYYTDEKVVEIKIAKPKDNASTLELICNQLADVKKANICLSGGLDSQFMLRLAHKLGIATTAYTYLALWNGSPINTDDYVYAQLSAKKLNIKLETVEIELLDFFNNQQHLQYGKKYGLTSPQIAIHLHFLSLLKDLSGHLFVGGDTPLLCKNSTQQEGPGDIIGINPSFFIRNAFAYRRLAEEHNISLVKDIFLYTPEIIYKTLQTSIEVVKKHKVHLEHFEHHPDYMHDHRVKYLIMEEILPGAIDPLYKSTGFEKLKKLLASETGVYNQFDINYRKIMEEQHRKNMRNTTEVIQGATAKGLEGSVKFIADNIPADLTEKFRQSITKYNSQPYLSYTFDF